jgi:hypothetical protein
VRLLIARADDCVLYAANVCYALFSVDADNLLLHFESWELCKFGKFVQLQTSSMANFHLSEFKFGECN